MGKRMRPFYKRITDKTFFLSMKDRLKINLQLNKRKMTTLLSGHGKFLFYRFNIK